MSDLINRQAAINEIEGLPKYFDKTDTLCLDYADVLAVLSEHLPSAEPEIIRCKDCKYMTEHYDTDGNVPYWTCSEWDSGTDYDGFCHYAERRQDDSNKDRNENTSRIL